MLKWRGIEISLLDDAELVKANAHIQQLKDDYNKISQSIKFLNKFKNQPLPKINPVLIELDTEIQSELKSRKNSHG